MNLQYLILYNYTKNVKHLCALTHKQISVLIDDFLEEIFNYLTFNLKCTEKQYA